MFAAIQSYFAAALTFIAQTQAWVMLVGAVTYLSSLLVTTFGLSAGVAMGLAINAYLLAFIAAIYVVYLGGKWVAPKVAFAYGWAKNKITGFFKKPEAAAPAATAPVAAQA